MCAILNMFRDINSGLQYFNLYFVETQISFNTVYYININIYILMCYMV